MDTIYVLLLFVLTPQIELIECCVWFQCLTQWRCTYVPNHVTCLFDENGNIVDCWWMPFVCCFFCVHSSNWVEWVLCLISVHHSMMLLLFLQSCCLLFLWEWKKNRLLMNILLCVVSFVLTTQIESSECCVWFQCITQWCCSSFSNAVVCWFDENGKERIVVESHLCCLFCFHNSDLAQ